MRRVEGRPLWACGATGWQRRGGRIPLQKLDASRQLGWGGAFAARPSTDGEGPTWLNATGVDTPDSSLIWTIDLRIVTASSLMSVTRIGSSKMPHGTWQWQRTKELPRRPAESAGAARRDPRRRASMMSRRSWVHPGRPL